MPEPGPDPLAHTPPFEEWFASTVAALDLDRLIVGMEERLDGLFEVLPPGQIRSLHFTGSGNSWFASLAVADAVRALSGRPVHVSAVLEFSRYEVASLPAGAVVLPVSNSGGSSRTVEAAARAHAAGVPVVGMTGSQTGPLAEAATYLLARHAPPEPPLPAWVSRAYLHVNEYLAQLVAGYLVGARLGLRDGRLSRRAYEDVTAALRAGVAAAAETARLASGPASRVAERLDGARGIFVLGAGPNWGTALYAAAKFHEEVPANAAAQELEEWAHLQYFFTLVERQAAVTVVLAPQGRAHDRAVEILRGVRAAEAADLVLPVAGYLDEPYSPLAYHVPLHLATFHLGRRRGRDLVPLRRPDAFRLTRGSPIGLGTPGGG